MSRIALVGTEGAGKTVFIAALAYYLHSLDDPTSFLDPQNASTQQHINRVLTRLNAGDWPASTPSGVALSWTLHLPQIAPVHLVVLDPPGQDIRSLFSEDANVEDCPPEFQLLVETCRAAEFVLFLVNLKDFIGERSSEQRLSNELALKFAMDFVTYGRAQPGQCALLFTQVDLYAQVAQQEGDWLSVARKYLPLLYRTHLHDGRVRLFAVTAVQDTKVITTDDGKPIRVPAAGLQPTGFAKLVEWLHQALIASEENARAQEANANISHVLKWVGIVAVVGIVAYLLISSLGWLAERRAQLPRRRVVWEDCRKSADGIFADTYTYKAKIANNGDSGWIKVKVTLQTPDEKSYYGSTDAYIRTGVPVEVQVPIDVYSSGQPTYSVTLE